MEFKDVLLSRKSVRKYKSTPVDEKILKEIIELGMTAPTATNLQHWYFVAVTKPESRAKLDVIMQGTADGILPELNKRFADYPNVIDETYSFVSTLGGAPVCILAFLYKDYENHNDAVQSVAAGLENIVLAARYYGLDTCWMTAPIDSNKADDLRREFAPDKGEFIAMLTLGYSDQPNTKSPKRKDGRYIIL